MEPLVWPFGESRPEVTVLHLREKKGNRKARRLTKEDGCYVLKWQLDSTLFIGEIFAIILDYLMDEFLSVERMIQAFDSMCTVHALLSQPRDPKDLRSGVEKLGTGSEPKILSFHHHGAKASYFRCLTAGYLRERYTPFIKQRNLDVWPEELDHAEWWVNDKSFLELLFRSRSFCVDCFCYLPLHVYERPAGPGTQVWQPPLTNDEDNKPSPSGYGGSSNLPRIEFVSQMLRNPTALVNHLLGNSNDFMQYDPLWRGEDSYEELLQEATFLPTYLGGEANSMPLENVIKQRYVRAFERNRQQTAHPVAPPRCFRCLNKRYPMMDLPSAWGLLTESIFDAFSEEPGETEDKGMTDLCETLMDVLPDDMLYTLKTTGRSKDGKKSTAPSDRMCQAACLVPPSPKTSQAFAKKERLRETLQDALTRSMENGIPGQDFDSVNGGSFAMGVFNSCVTNLMPPVESLEGYSNDDATDFHKTVTEITESFLWHVNKKHGPTVDPWGPPGTQASYIPSSVHSCNSFIKHYSFHPKDGDAKLFETKEDYGGDHQPLGGPRSIPEESESLFSTEEEKFAAYEENHPPLAWPFCDHKSMRSNGGVILQYVLLKLLCLLPYKKMVAPRSVHKRSGFGNALVGRRSNGSAIGGPEPPFIEFFNNSPKETKVARDENTSSWGKSVGLPNAGMDALYSSSYSFASGRRQPKGWERLGWFYRLNADVDPTSRSTTRLKLLRGCPASYAESDIHMDRLSFMPPAQLCRIMGLKQVVSTLKRQLEESRPKFKVPKPSPTSYKPNMAYLFTGADWGRYNKDCREKGRNLGGDAVPTARMVSPMNKLGEALTGKEMPVIQEADVLLLARLFSDFIREFRSDPESMSWATFEKKVGETFFNMWMGVDRVPCSAISVTKNGYPQTFLSQFHSDGVWRYGDDIRHRLWYGCIGIFNPFDENLNTVDAYVFSQKAARRARKLDNGLRTDTLFDVNTGTERERHSMIFCNKYTKIGITPMRRCLGSFRLQSAPGREYEDNRLVTIYSGANVYQLKLHGNEDQEVGMEEAVPINSKLTKECNAYVAWHKRDVSENHYRSGRNVKLFWNTEFEDAAEQKEEPCLEAFETPDKGQLKKIATPDAPVRPSTLSQPHLVDDWVTPKKTKKRKSWQRVQDRIGKQWMKKKKLDEVEEIWIEDEENEEEKKD